MITPNGRVFAKAGHLKYLCLGFAQMPLEVQMFNNFPQPCFCKYLVERSCKPLTLPKLPPQYSEDNESEKNFHKCVIYDGFFRGFSVAS